MVHSWVKWLRGRACLLRWVAILAIACQVGAVGGSLTAAVGDAQAAQLAAASILCQGVHHTATSDAPSPHRHVPGQAFFNIVSAAGQSALLAASDPPLSGPAAGKIGEVTTPPARAPPGLYAASSFPRGPPQPV